MSLYFQSVLMSFFMQLFPFDPAPALITILQGAQGGLHDSFLLFYCQNHPVR